MQECTASRQRGTGCDSPPTHSRPIFSTSSDPFSRSIEMGTSIPLIGTRYFKHEPYSEDAVRCFRKAGSGQASGAKALRQNFKGFPQAFNCLPPLGKHETVHRQQKTSDGGHHLAGMMLPAEFQEGIPALAEPAIHTQDGDSRRTLQALLFNFLNHPPCFFRIFFVTSRRIIYCHDHESSLERHLA